MKNKRGFTLIELLAVIIILGILMIIAIPSVTKYINDSRKSAYVDTAKEIVSGTRNKVNDGKLGMYDTNTTYYIPVDYIKTENASKSPYGEFVQAYVGVVYDGNGYKYYWISVDETGQGVDKVTLADKLDEDDIKSDLNASEIESTVKTTGIGGRQKILILDENGNWTGEFNADNKISEDGGVIVYPVGKTESTLEVGDIVTIGTEDFYVLNNTDSELKLLARYNLKVGTDYGDGGVVLHEHTPSEEGYGRQSSEARGRPYDGGNSICAVAFSSTAYWEGQTGEGKKYPDNYVYDSNSAIYPYLENYKTYLEGFGITPEVRLLGKNDQRPLFDHGKTDILYTTSFWRGDSYFFNNNEYIAVYYYSDGASGISPPNHKYTYGVRPEVIIQK